jgi:aconitate hydratase
MRVAPRAKIPLVIRRADGNEQTIELGCRIDTANEVQVWAAGGMMPFVLRQVSRAPSGEIA